MAMAISLLDLRFSAIFLSSSQRSAVNNCVRRNCPLISFSKSSNSKLSWKTSRIIFCQASGGPETEYPSRSNKSKKKSTDNGTPVILGFSEGRDEDAARMVCPGCGVFMQDENPGGPGYFVRPARDSGFEAREDDDEEMVNEFIEDEEEEKKNKDKVVDEIEEWIKTIDGFADAGSGFGRVAGETLTRKKRVSKKDMTKNKRTKAESVEETETPLVCARCYSLRHYGQVKDQRAENLLPDFDFESSVGSRLIKSSRNSRTVVVTVVDAVDFDGSFPRRAAKMMSDAIEAGKGEELRFILVATKVDLLPPQISPARLDRWVRTRARVGGAPKLNGVFLVSAHKDLGVRNLIARIKELAGPRGNVWVIGAQNAGKSTLINTIGKNEGGKVTHLTEAPVPGTTLGILRIGGILPAKAKLYDTPGLLHPYQISRRLNRDEQKMIEIRKELKPRSYRVKVGQTVHIGGLMRLDVNQASVETIYVTAWASVHIPLHMGKVENANELKEKHFGERLQPPIGEERVKELGEWNQTEIKISGNSWDVNAVDVAVAGLGWFSLGIKGNATLAIWTYDGVHITVREPLVLDRAHRLERPGFLLSKVVSQAISKKSKLKSNNSSKTETLESKEKKRDVSSTEILVEMN